MIDDTWDQLVTAAVLGTDRRAPSDLPDGPLADLVADAVERDPARRLLTAIATVGAARAAGFRPDPPVPTPPPPIPDPRPWCPTEATRTWMRIRREWPVLEDEWIRAVVAGGWRLPADVTVALLERYRGDPARRRWVIRAAGPVAEWICDLAPVLRARATRTVDDDGGDAALPPLPMPERLAAALDADVDGVVAAIEAVIGSAGSPAAQRAVLVHLVARCRPDVLVGTARRLRSGSVPSGWSATVDALVELAELRHRMRVELTPSATAVRPVAVTPPR